jgi:hemerythrin-like domain-containing protein
MEPVPPIEKLRRDHANLLQLMERALLTLDNRKAADHETVLNSLVSFEEALRIHLEIEDRILYPILMDHEDEEIRTLTGEYVKEMRSTFDSFRSFIPRWEVGGTSPPSRDVLTSELKDYASILMQRIRFEEEVLFPTLESLSG